MDFLSRGCQDCWKKRFLKNHYKFLLSTSGAGCLHYFPFSSLSKGGHEGYNGKLFIIFQLTSAFGQGAYTDDTSQRQINEMMNGFAKERTVRIVTRGGGEGGREGQRGGGRERGREGEGDRGSERERRGEVGRKRDRERVLAKEGERQRECEGGRGSGEGGGVDADP